MNADLEPQTNQDPSSFANRLIAWQRTSGRHDLPWQRNRDPYRVWVSEVMLQQTRVGTVLAYFERWMQTLPTIESLANADLDQVLGLWAGLGYYRRARYLHQAAQQIQATAMPTTAEGWQQLPGVGRSTAAAIAATCFGQAVPILDGNVKRVLARWLGLTQAINQPATEKQLWQAVTKLMPQQHCDVFNQALMDLGSGICVAKTPSAAQCASCPVHHDCQARAQGKQADIPVRKSKASRPHRQTYVLLRQCQQQVLLEKRGVGGIWPGLWSLAEFADEASLQQYAAREHLQAQAPLAPLRHEFTHFSLTLHPRLFVDASHQAHANGKWVSLADLDFVGIPAPIKLLLQAALATPAGSSASPP